MKETVIRTEQANSAAEQAHTNADSQERCYSLTTSEKVVIYLLDGAELGILAKQVG